MEKKTQQNQSVEKAMAIIEYMAKCGKPMKLFEMSNELGINQSTLLRFLLTLENNGYVAQEMDTSRYFLTMKLCKVANMISGTVRISDIVLPHIRKISETLNQSVSCAIEKDGVIVYVETVRGPQEILSSTRRIGSISPMHCTDIGKLILSDKKEKEIDEILLKSGMTAYTENTLTTKQQLFQELNIIRSQGYAIDNEECEMGAKSVAVPIRDYTGRIIAGISVTGFVFNITTDFIIENIDYLISEANEVSLKLGYEN